MKFLRTAILWLILTSFGASVTFARSAADSLRALLSAHPVADAGRVDLLIALASAYENVSNDSMIAPASEALTLARRLHDERSVMNSLTELSIAYGHQYKFDTGLQLHIEALTLAKKLGDKQKIASLTMNVGEDHFSLYHYQQAINYIDSSLVLCRQIHDTLIMAKCMANLSTIYYVSGDYPQGVDYGLKAIPLYEAVHYKYDLTVIYTNIGSIYAELGDYKKAIDYHSRALSLGRETKNNDAISAALNNLGYTYHEMKDYSKALEYYTDAYDFANKLLDYDTRNVARQNIATIYMDMGDYQRARPLLDTCLKEGIRLNNTQTIIVCHVCLAKILQQTHGSTQQIIEHLKKGFDVSMQINAKQLIQKCSRNLSEAYEQENDLVNALKYYKIYHDYSDSIYNDKNNKRIQQLQFNYEIASKENRITKLEKDNLLAKSRNDRQNLILVSLLIGLALFALFIALLYRNQVKLSKTNKLVYQQKRAIEQQTADLQELNTFKDKILSVLSHDLRGPIGSINSFIEILDYHELKEEEFQEIRESMHNQVESVMLLVDNLLHWASASFRGREAGFPEVIDMYEISQLSIALLQNIARSKDVIIVNEVPRNMKGYGNYEQIDIVIRNLIANAIKFIPQQGKITVHGISYENVVAISIADTGIGMSQQQLATLFTKSQTSTYGTGGEKGIGLGLLLCKEFIELNGGTISVTSELNKGTVFTITIPKPPAVA